MLQQKFKPHNDDENGTQRPQVGHPATSRFLRVGYRGKTRRVVFAGINRRIGGKIADVALWDIKVPALKAREVAGPAPHHPQESGGIRGPLDSD